LFRNRSNSCNKVLVILSIITPVFNAGKWLEACIANVAEQAEGGIEHLIIDGGSTDGSIEILKSQSEKLPHLRWISEKDRGQSDAMNKGIRLAKGKWIGFLNADDFYERNTLYRVLNIIRNKPEQQRLVLGNLNVWDENENLISVNKPSSMSAARMLADMCEWPYNPSAYFYPADLHSILGFFPVDEHFAMDYDFILKLMLAGIPLDYKDETWGNFRLLPEAKTGRDQAGNDSYKRAKTIRLQYYSQSGFILRIKTKLLIGFWALRNKLYGFIRRII
jgi:glycosyltransferase involved in cell wall biosynthesis